MALLPPTPRLIDTLLGPADPARATPLRKSALLSTRSARVRAVLALVVAALLALGVVVAVEFAVSVGPQTRAFDDKASGIAGQRPASWKISATAAGLSLMSPDHTTLIEIAAPGPASEASNLLAGTVVAIERGYSDVAMQAHTSRRIGQLAADVAVFSARNRKGVPLHVLAAAAPGHRVAYLLEVFTATSSRPATVLAAQTIVDSLRLTR